jgi:hypothetical protein
MKNQGSNVDVNKKQSEEKTITTKQLEQKDLVDYLIKNPATVMTRNSGDPIAKKFKISDRFVWVAVVDFIGESDVTFEFQKKNSNTIERLKGKFRFGQGGIKHTILKLEDIEIPSRWKKFSPIAFRTQEDFLECRPATNLPKIPKILPRAPIIKFQQSNTTNEKKRDRDDDDMDDDDNRSKETNKKESSKPTVSTKSPSKTTANSVPPKTSNLTLLNLFTKQIDIAVKLVKAILKGENPWKKSRVI